MGATTVLCASGGTWVSAISDSVVAGSSAFHAEIWAVELGLIHAWNSGIRTLVCMTDCLGDIQVLDE